MNLLGKVVAITGGGSGIGRELVLGALARGAEVAAVDRNPSALADTLVLAKAQKPSLATFTADITDRSAVEALPAALEARFGRVDGLINCAGIIQPFVHLTELSYEAIDRVFEVNWRGTLYMTKAFLPSLLARPEAHLANVSSMGGFLPVPGQTIYGASKAAVKLLTEGLQAELGDTPVRVTLIYPGAVATNIVANSGVALAVGDAEGQRTLTPVRAAEIILDAIEANQARVLVGADAKALDFFYRLSPLRASAFIAQQMKRLLAQS